MKPSTKDFLAELYELDPGLRAHEDELKPLIEKLLKSDPSQAPDPEFVAALRLQLNEKVDALSERSASRFPNLFYLFGGALTVAILVPVAYLGYQKGSSPEQTPSAPIFAYDIQNAEREAFGSLGAIAPAQDPSRSARPQSGGGGPGMGGVMIDSAATEQATNPVVPPNSDAGMPVDAKMIAPYPVTQFTYVYDGELPALTDTVPVFLRNSGSKSLPLSAIASSLNLGSINASSFSGMNIDSMTFAQNTPFGLQMFVNLRDSSINLDAQWEQWPMSKCTTDACYRNEQVKITDVPSDEQLIALARDFIADHAIDLESYGEPEVDHSWKLDYDRAPDKSQAYVPEVQRVIFPLMFEGKPVYDQSGIKTGLSVGIHAKHKRVQNVYGLMDRTYRKSEYAGVTDPAAIQTFLSQLDNYGPMPIDARASSAPTIKNATVILGTPTISYSLYYRYANNRNDELVIPSLVFPVASVEGADTNSWYRQTVVVPLAAEMLNQQNGGGMVRPMMEGDMVK